MYLEEAGGTGGSPPKDKRTLKKLLDRLADALKRLTEKAAEALSAIVGSVVSAILSFLGKAVGFVVEYTWALIVFVVGLTGVWLMQRIKNDLVFASAFFIRSFVFFSRPGIFNTHLRYLASHNAMYDNS